MLPVAGLKGIGLRLLLKLSWYPAILMRVYLNMKNAKCKMNISLSSSIDFKIALLNSFAEQQHTRQAENTVPTDVGQRQVV